MGVLGVWGGGCMGMLGGVGKKMRVRVRDLGRRGCEECDDECEREFGGRRISVKEFKDV